MKTTSTYQGPGGVAVVTLRRSGERRAVTVEVNGEVHSDQSYGNDAAALSAVRSIEASLKAAGFRYQNEREDEVSAVSKDSDIRCPFCGEEDEDILYNLRTGGIECGGCGDHTVEELDAHIESIRTRWAAMSDKLKSLAGALR